MTNESKHTPCAACDDTAEVEISHYWDTNGDEQEVDMENCMIRCPQCSSDVETNLRAQNAALLEALRAARPDLVAYSNSYGGDYLESLRLVDAAIALTILT